MLGGTLATLAGLAAWFLLSPKYTAFAKLRVNYVKPMVLDGPANTTNTDYGIYLRTQAAYLTSRPVLWSTLKRDDVKRLNLESKDSDPLAGLEENIKVDFQDGSEFLTLLVSHTDPATAITLAKGIVTSFMEDIVYQEERARVEKVAGLEKVYSDAVASHKAKQDTFKKMANQIGASDPGQLLQHQIETMEALRDSKSQRNQIHYELVKAQAALDAHDAKTKAILSGSVSESALTAAVEVDPNTREDKKKLDDIEAFAARYEMKATDYKSEPTWRSAQAEIGRLKTILERRRSDLRAELKKRAEMGAKEDLAQMRAQLENTVKSFQTIHEQLKAEVEELVKKASKTGGSSSELENLREELKREELIVNDLGIKLEKERVELRAAKRITVAQESELQKKDMKKQILATIVAPVAVFFAVCTGLAWTEYRKRRVLSAGEVSRGLGIRVVGAVPDMPNLERHLVGPTGEPELEGHPVLESIDAIRTCLLRDADAEATRLVLVTSATTGEGKTTLASHLAGSLARAGRKTLLIDGDLRTPSLHQLFELPVQPGFSEVLLGEVELADAIQPTTLDGLSLIAAGQWDREVMQALARNGLAGIFEKLREEFDFVVIDSHPVLPAADSLLLGQQVDGVILSVLREVSQMPRVYAAAERLTSLGIRVLGAVVNGTDPEEVFAPLTPTRAAA
jgi:capsular exopolysaccharide synthesis family protein